MAGRKPPSKVTVMTPRNGKNRTRTGQSRRSVRSKNRRQSGWRTGWKWRLAVGALVVIVALVAWAVLARAFAKRANTSLTRFDAIIVLGTPADRDGNPTPGQLARVDEAVHEYERGVAPRMILSGGAAHNQYVEAQVMARVAHAKGIPEEAIFVEPESRDTIQNACYSARIMKAHGWRSAEVISNSLHLPRAGMIFDRLGLEWRTHAARPVRPESEWRRARDLSLETLKTALYLVWSRQYETCEP